MSLAKLQKAAGVKDDGVFGPNTFKACSAYLGIKDQIKAVHFWAQVAHETGNFGAFEENLNYSAQALLNVFGKYFPTLEIAQEYERKAAKIANKVYANRMGNGDEDSGDGYKYRGRGALQLTGKNNYEAFGNYIKNLQVIQKPNIVLDSYCFESAMFFFDKNNLWSICKDTKDSTVKKLTKRINGGYNGLAHRISLTKNFKNYTL